MMFRESDDMPYKDQTYPQLICCLGMFHLNLQRKDIGFFFSSLKAKSFYQQMKSKINILIILTPHMSTSVRIFNIASSWVIG